MHMQEAGQHSVLHMLYMFVPEGEHPPSYICTGLQSSYEAYAILLMAFRHRLYSFVQAAEVRAELQRIPHGHKSRDQAPTERVETTSLT